VVIRVWIRLLAVIPLQWALLLATRAWIPAQARAVLLLATPVWTPLLVALLAAIPLWVAKPVAQWIPRHLRLSTLSFRLRNSRLTT
jgi:hypothetical protein